MGRRLFPDLPDDAVVPVALAHLVVGKSRATVYRWVQAGVLEATAGKVTAGAVRAANASIQRGQPAGRHAERNGGTSRGTE